MAKKTSAVSGLLYLTLSKIIFVIAGYAIYITVARMVGPELFGDYGVVVSIISVINMALITGSIQSISKFVSEAPGKAAQVKLQGLKLQVIVSVVVTVSFILLSDTIAHLLKDESLAPLFKLSALIPLFYSFYAVFIGYLNGQKQFKKQALFDITYSFLKCFLILLSVWLGFSIMGAVFGFVSAAGIILALSILTIGIRASGSPTVSLRKIFFFGFIINLFTASAYLFSSIDLLLIKSLVVKNLAGLYAGYYTAAQTIARIPYFLIVPLNLILFPLISSSTFSGKRTRTQYYIQNSLRYTLAIMTLMAVIISASSREIVYLVYSSKYQGAVMPLSLLAIGMLFYSLLIASSTIISGSGKPKISLAIILSALLISFGLNYMLVPRYGLIGAAIATSFTSLAALSVAVIYILKKFKAFIRIRSILNIFICGIVVYLIAKFIKAAGLMLLVEAVFLSFIYLLMLIITKELGKKELMGIKKLFKKSNVRK
jgi:stage V sporulation protein B